MPTELCRHIRTSGARCGSPALRGTPLCFYHDRLHRLHGSPEPPDTTPTVIHPIALSDRTQRDPLVAEYFAPASPRTLHLPPLEDAESIQIALSLLVTAMGYGHIDTKLATSMLYGLQIASINAARLNLAPARATLVRETVTGEDGRQLAPDEDPAEPHETVETQRGPLQHLLRRLDHEEHPKTAL